MKSFPSRKVLAYEAGISIKSLDRALSALEKRGLISKKARAFEDKQTTNLYEVLLVEKRGDTMTPGGDNVTPGGVQLAHGTLPNELTPIKNASIEALAQPVYGKPEINELFGYWEEKTGVRVQGKRDANRRACNNLLKKYNVEGVKKLIDGVGQAQNDRYAPRISDFCDLQSKLNQLLTWGRKHQTGKMYVIS